MRRPERFALIAANLTVLLSDPMRAVVCLLYAGKEWTMMGLIPMFDPPRDDTQETIHQAENLGVEVKMITGDHLTIAKETARILGMGTNIFPAEYMKDVEKAQRETGLDLHEIIHQAHGFAQVPSSTDNVPHDPEPLVMRRCFRRTSTQLWSGCRRVIASWA